MLPSGKIGRMLLHKTNGVRKMQGLNQTLTPQWHWSTPLINWKEHRQALEEIEVITAKVLDFTLEELILVYSVQFPVLQQNEDDTWYDTKNNIVFTCIKGLVGVDRPVWEQIRHMQAGLVSKHFLEMSTVKAFFRRG
jgi:hypothetical protein